MDNIRLGMRMYLYYGLVFVLSMCMLIFLPMIGSTQDIGYNLPTTKVGWIVFVVTKTVVAVINVLIFHCFICQAKVNIKDNDKYIKANEMLEKHRREIKPRSPRRFFTREYSVKGTTTFLFSALSVIALTNAILCFDWIAFLTYILTLLMGIIFGVLEMKKVESYWTEEYYAYALNYVSKNISDNTLVSTPTKQENALEEKIQPYKGITEEEQHDL